LKPDFAAIIFDCDGTLVDSEVPGMDVLRAMAQEAGLKLSQETAYAQFRGVRMADCVRWIGTQLQLAPQHFDLDFTDRVRRAMDARFRLGLKVIPGAPELLAKLKQPFCVATNGPRAKVELTLTVSGLRGFFGERVFSAYELGCFKPDPGLFLHAARALQVEPKRCAVVEDSLTGIEAGLDAGMTVFSLHPRNRLPPSIAHEVHCIDDLRALDAILHHETFRVTANGD